MFKTEPLFPAVQGDENDPGFFQSLIAFFTKLWSPGTSSAEQLGWAFGYDESGTLLAEVGSGGASSTGSTKHIWLPTASGPMPIAAIVNGSKFAVHADHLNTPRRLTNQQGDVAWQWGYSAFGEEKPTIAATRFADAEATNTGTTNTAPVTYNLRFPGQYFDLESGLHYNYFRTYDAKTGQYTQPDPIGLEGGWNRFAYAGGNPVLFSDSQGLLVPALILPFLGGGATLGGWGSAAVAAGAILAAASMPGDEPSAEKRTVPYPERKRGKYTCICRANRDGRSAENRSIDDKEFAMGYGEGLTLSEAKRAAEKDAKEKLGARSTHHIQCRCTGPNGDKIIPHG